MRSALVGRNTDLLRVPAAPAAETYTGLLYQHLDLASLSPTAHKRAAERLLVASALWGVVRLEDRIPSYRLNMGAKPPRMKSLAAFWRPALTKTLPPDELIVDMRSGSYAAAWRSSAGVVVSARAFTESNGERKVITHMAKAVRGEVARTLAKSSSTPDDPESIASLVERAGDEVELTPADGESAWNLDVIRQA